MTKEELVGAAYLKLTDGFPTMDASTWWDDVDLLLAPAVNYVMLGDYFLSKRDEFEEKIIQPLFIQTFKNISIVEDEDSGKKKMTLPKRPLALPKLRSIVFVGDMKDNEFVPMEQNGGPMQKYLTKFKECQTSWIVEGVEIFLENAPPILKKGKVKMVVSAKDLANTDEVVLPEGGELQVMDLMVQFFTGQKPLPKDYYNTGHEPNIQ